MSGDDEASFEWFTAYLMLSLKCGFEIVRALHVTQPLTITTIQKDDGTVTQIRARGQPHCLYAAANVYSNGIKEWYQNGVEHRRGGPSYEDRANGYLYLEWTEQGINHRDDGPAIIDYSIDHDDPTKIYWNLSWYRNGVCIREISRNENYQSEDRRYKNSLLHCEDVSAKKAVDYWPFNDLHCLDGPALIRADGTEEWYVDGKRIEKECVPNACSEK